MNHTLAALARGWVITAREPVRAREDDDPGGQCDEDGVNTLFPIGNGPEGLIADPGE